MLDPVGAAVMNQRCAALADDDAEPPGVLAVVVDHLPDCGVADELMRPRQAVGADDRPEDDSAYAVRLPLDQPLPLLGKIVVYEQAGNSRRRYGNALNCCWIYAFHDLKSSRVALVLDRARDGLNQTSSSLEREHLVSPVSCIQLTRTRPTSDLASSWTLQGSGFTRKVKN
jgi:hypothetical protein